MFPKLPHFNESNFRECCKQVVATQATYFSEGNGTLHIPQATIKNRRLIEGMEVHTEPEIFIQTHGKARFIMPDESFVVNEGDLCFLPRHVPHTEEIIKNSDGEFFNLVIRPLPNKIIELHFGDAGNEKSPRVGCEPKAFSYQDEIWGPEFVDTLLIDSYTVDKTDSIMLRSGLTMFIQWLARLLEEQKEPEVQKKTPLIQRCQQFIQRELHCLDLSVPLIAKACGCSPNHLSAAYHHQCGIKLVDYINELRIAKAEQLLEKTPLQISEVSYACGFRDPAYFSRLFKKKTGFSPKRYRTTHISMSK